MLKKKNELGETAYYPRPECVKRPERIQKCPVHFVSVQPERPRRRGVDVQAERNTLRGHPGGRWASSRRWAPPATGKRQARRLAVVPSKLYGHFVGWRHGVDWMSHSATGWLPSRLTIMRVAMLVCDVTPEIWRRQIFEAVILEYL